MLKTKEFIGNIKDSSVEDALNEFLTKIDAEDIVDVKYNTNIVSIRKSDGTADTKIISSALLIYQE